MFVDWKSLRKKEGKGEMDDHKRRNKNRTCHSHCVEMGLKLTFSLFVQHSFPPFPTLNIIFPTIAFLTSPETLFAGTFSMLG